VPPHVNAVARSNEAYEQQMGKEDFDAIFHQEPDPDDEPYFYLNPALECPTIKCRLKQKLIWLPYGRLPESDEGGTPLGDSDPVQLPPDGWSEDFGCIACGRISTYAGRQVEMWPVQKNSGSIYHTHADVWRVTVPCADKNCGSLISVHLDMRDYRGTPNTAHARDAIDALKNALSGWKARCGHELKEIPKPFYHAERVTHRMW
jgi:hypothetical protein